MVVEVVMIVALTVMAIVDMMEVMVVVMVMTAVVIMEVVMTVTLMTMMEGGGSDVGGSHGVEVGEEEKLYLCNTARSPSSSIQVVLLEAKLKP